MKVKQIGLLLVLSISLVGCTQEFSAPIINAMGPKNSRVKTDTAAQQPVKVKESQPVYAKTEPAYQVYIVQHGDTLSGIARRYHMNYLTLAKFNHIGPPYLIHIGERLMIPGTYKPTSAPMPSKVESNRKVAVHATTTSPVHKSAAVAAATTTVNASTSRMVDGIDWSWPVHGTVTQSFKQSGGQAIELTSTQGNVKATSSGMVVYAGSDLHGNGQMLIIKHANGYLSAYSGNKKLLVKQGQKVQRGQVIAQLVPGEPLEFQIRHLGNPVNPMTFLPQ